MLRYLLKRILVTLPVVFGVITLCFLLIHFVPGDPTDIMLGDQASSFDKTALRNELGLNKPLLTQYKDYLFKLSHLDLGRSLHTRQSVFTSLVESIPATAELASGAMLLALLLGIPLGVFSAIKQYSWVDNSLLTVGLLGMSVPGIFLGPLLIWVFAILLPWFPVSERGGLENLVLPAVSLALPLGAVIMRMTRASMLDVIKEDYISVARAKGSSFFTIYFKHALSNAMMPIITIVGLQVGALLTGTVITETIFDWPGVGTLLFRSIQQRDYPLTQACILFVSLTYVFVNLITDLAYAVVNPKVRLS